MTSRNALGFGFALLAFGLSSCAASSDTVAAGGSSNTGGSSTAGASNAGGVGGAATGGTTATGGATTGGTSNAGGTAGTNAGVGGTNTGGTNTGGANTGGTSTGGTNTGGANTGGTSTGGTNTGGANTGGTNTGGTSTGGTSTGGTSTGGTSTGGTSTGGAGCSGPIGSLSGPLSTGIVFMDTAGQRVNAHGGGIIKEGGTYYMHGEFFLNTTTDNNFHGFSMYSSTNMSTWKNEGIILPTQASGELGPNRKGERPHIIKCPSTGEFVLYAHAASADYQTDKEVVYATSSTVNGQYAYKGPLKNASGQIAAHSDMSAYADSTGAYVITESGHVYTLATDCHSWLSDKSFGAVNGDSGGSESPTVFKAGSTYYWIGSYKTGWRANNNFYSTAPAITGPWTYQGYVAPVVDPTNNISDQRTWLSQSTWVQPVAGCQGTVYVYWGDHWDGTQDTTAPGRHNYLAGYVFQPLVFNGTKISLPTYQDSWTLDVGAGTWLP